MERMVLQLDIRLKTFLEESMFVFNGRLSKILDYDFFVKLFERLSKLNKNRENFSDNKRADWTHDLRLG